MKKNYLLILLIALSFIGCRMYGVRGSGNLEEETRELEEFNRIDVSGAYDVEIILGKYPGVSIKAEDNLIEYIETKVRGNKLYISNSKSLSPSKDIEIVVTTSYLDEIESSGASDVIAKNIDSKEFLIDLSGAGTIDLFGKTDYLRVNLSGAGNLNARDLFANHVRINVSGASDAEVQAHKSLKAEVSGVGNIDYYGNPKDITTNVSGVGNISKR